MQPSGEILNPIELTEAEVGFYQTEGYLLIPGLLKTPVAEPLCEEILEVLRFHDPLPGKLQQTKDFFAGGLIERLVHDPRLLALAEALMQGESTPHSPFTAVKAPGGGGFHFHQDNQYTEFKGPGINFWFAVSGADPQNGSIRVVPRSQNEGTHEWVESGDGDEYRKIDWEPDYFLPTRMRPGDCLVFNRLTIHGSGPNATDEPRVGYAVQFHRNDTKAFVDGEWRLLKDHPRIDITPLKRD